MKRFVCTTAALLTLGTIAVAEESIQPLGPPAEVVAAWEAGSGDLLASPPEWVIAMRSGDSERSAAMPPWVAARLARAAEIGLPGPPPEVIEAWENGEGEVLPGPPQFILELLEMFGR